MFERLPIGAKSGVYKPVFGNFEDLKTFVAEGGQKGVQRPVLSPGTTLPLHPVAFLVITRDRVYGIPVSEEIQKGGPLTSNAFAASTMRTSPI